MLSSPLNLCVTCTNNNLVPNTYQSQSFNHFVECYLNLDSHVSPGLKIHLKSSRGIQLRRAFQSEEASKFSELRYQFNSSYLDKEIHYVVEKRSDKDKNEMLRREKIGLANKGRVPWNKGKKHTAETRELIGQRTKEALNDPKVRKKMSECPRTLSDQTKAKISKTITQQWRERLKIKRSRENFISKWGVSIAEAAKKGGYGQQELEWDSYEKIEKEIVFQQLQRAADVAKAKEMAQLSAERRAKSKAEKVKNTLQRRMAKVKGFVKKKTKEEKEELAAAQELKLKQRLTKIHRKKSVNDPLRSRDQRAWERLDLEFLKEDMKKKDISLADQIREVKNKKASIP